MKYGSKANLGTKAAPISQNWWKTRNCTECKKLLETKKVARNTRSCQKVAEQLVESPNGAENNERTPSPQSPFFARFPQFVPFSTL